MTRTVHALLLRAYPASLRRELGDEIHDVFRARLAVARARGLSAMLRLCWLEAMDSLRSGLSARWAVSRSGSRLPNLEPESPRERATRLMDALAHDLRYGLRAFRVAPGFAFAAVTVLAVAIGANTAMFSVINAVLLRPLPFAEPDRLVSIFETNPERGWTRAQVAAANYLDWRERTTRFDGIAAHNDWLVERTHLRDGEPTVVNVNEVTGNFFDVLGAELILGRGFDADDDWMGGERKIVLSYSYWLEQSGADPGVIGNSVVLDDEPYTVVGVAASGFRFPFPKVDGWVPVAWDPDNLTAVFFRRAHGMRAIGRLADGVSAEAAESELGVIAAQLANEYPETNVEMGTGLMPLHEWVVGDTRTPLTMLLLAVGLVLIIACANVANMQLARATDRRAEMALRAALGAHRMRLVRQSLIESLVLSAAGGAVGLALAAAGVRVLVNLLPVDFPRLGEMGPDWQVLAFTLVAVVVTGLVSGLAPSLSAARHDLGLELGGTRGTVGRRGGRATALLVAAEIALVLPVAIGATLMIRTLDAIGRVDPGFDAADTTVVGISLPRARYGEATDRAVFFDTLLRGLRDKPRIDAAAMSTRLPFVNQRWSSDFRAESWLPDEYGVGVRHDEISRDLFRTMGVAIVDGRDFEQAELDTEPVAIVNKALADTYFPDRSPVGERLCFDRAAEDCRFWYTVVGVVDNVHRVNLTVQEEPSIYGSLIQNGSSNGFLLVRSSLPTADVVDVVAASVGELDAALPFYTVTTMEAVVRDSVGRERLLLALLGAFASIAALLAAFGVYSVVSYSTANRTREIGVRVSLGAQPRDLMRSVIGRGMLPVALGLGFGTALALLGAGAFSGFIFGVGVRDPLSYAAVALGLGAIAIVACIVPGFRALRVDPVVALRAD